MCVALSEPTSTVEQMHLRNNMIIDVATTIEGAYVTGVSLMHGSP